MAFNTTEPNWQLDKLISQVEKSNSLLRAVLRVLIDSQEDMKLGKKIEILDSVGLRPIEIAQILGTSPNAVSVYKAKMKKRGTASEPAAPQPTQTTATNPV